MLIKGSFEDYIYILVGIIWLAFSVYKGIQKKKAAENKPVDTNDNSPQEKKKSIFDEFLSQIITEETPLPYQQADDDVSSDTKVDKSVAKADNSLFSYDDYYEESNDLDKTNVYQQETGTSNTKEAVQKTPPKAKVKKKRFDLRKAIVYSEILNRPYF